MLDVFGNSHFLSKIPSMIPEPEDILRRRRRRLQEEIDTDVPDSNETLDSIAEE